MINTIVSASEEIPPDTALAGRCLFESQVWMLDPSKEITSIVDLWDELTAVLTANVREKNRNSSTITQLHGLLLNGTCLSLVCLLCL